MAKEQVTATLTAEQGGPRGISVNYDFGGTLEEAVDKFGDESVLNNFKAQAKINLQAFLRRVMKPKEGEEAPDNAAIQALVDKWMPGTKTVTRKTPLERLQAVLGPMSAEQKREAIKALKEQLAEEAGGGGAG